MKTGKIALAHLRELPDYYTRLARIEAEGEAAQSEARCAVVTCGRARG